ncbi:sensor histidine kinase [Dictyobacter arantiisoli]|uniref:histidine kinase n=1 Tax=Dictyobacter arantiisoli TaxID=2014874 RepID=A0A5A5T688_9CHLR|nr:HAMP domain-containing sensor histidine kinase [Dictyobacter arantiisoli]GCF06549.1 hypothetical protein KDI_01130 [Dictyobacter arantiisoli]
MSARHKASGFSLKSKLVLSYLLVILGTVLVLTFTVSIVIRNYYYQVEIAELKKNTVAPFTNRLLNFYAQRGNFNNIAGFQDGVPPSQILMVFDAQGTLTYCSASDSSGNSFFGQQYNNNQYTKKNCDNSAIKQVAQKTLSGIDQLSGDVNLTNANDTVSAIYVSTPLVVNSQTVGVLYMAAPNFINGSSAVTDVINQINWSIIMTGLGVAIIAALGSYLFVRRFVRPLEALTVAAEQMKRGNYTEHVQPNSHDEVGLLTQTFNEMADTIEADVNELRHQDQMRRELIANIAHDLATPLTAIQGLSEAIADDVITTPEARQETAQRIGREIQRLRRLVADVRQMTMLEAGQIQLDLAPLDLHSLADETVAVIEPECTAMGITIKNTIPTTTPQVQADSDRITQVLLNLLDNARRHTKAEGKISIDARQQGNQILVAVTDTGIGIDPADLPHIFERFYRADRSRAAQTGGSGLGLAIVKAIITAHGGQIWAESTPGEGTHVVFTLPLVAPVLPPQNIPPSRQHARPQRVGS